MSFDAFDTIKRTFDGTTPRGEAKLKTFFELGKFFKKKFTDGHITLLNPLILVNFLTRSCILATLK